jgi:hypothetical protein
VSPIQPQVRLQFCLRPFPFVPQRPHPFPEFLSERIGNPASGHVEIIGITLLYLCGNFPTFLKMRLKVHYVVCWTEDDGIYSCAHEHGSIAEALECECLIPDGQTFIRSRDEFALRSLDEVETERFYEEVHRLRTHRG